MPEDEQTPTKLICNNYECAIENCPYHKESLGRMSYEEFDKCAIRARHLEDNPMYCKKGNWYGYQVPGADLTKEE